MESGVIRCLDTSGLNVDFRIKRVDCFFSVTEKGPWTQSFQGILLLGQTKTRS